MNHSDLISDSYLKLREMLASPILNIREFSAIVSRDAGISSMVLSIANREIFGYKGQVDSVEHAVELLGLGQISEIVLEVVEMLSLGQTITQPTPTNVIRFPLRKIWRAATLCA